MSTATLDAPATTPMDEFVARWNARPKRQYPFASMSRQQLLDTIAEHEIVHRGIDWRKAAAAGEEGMRTAVDAARAHVEQRVSALTPAERATATRLGILDANGRVPMLAALGTTDPTPMPVPSSAQPYPCWFWNADRAASYTGLTGGDIETAIAQLVATFQVMENDDAEGVVETMMNAAIWGFGVNGLVAVYNVIRTLASLSEATEAYAVFEGVIAVGINVIRLAISVFVLAILVPIVLLMQKNAAAIMVLVNNTNNDLVLQDLYCEHGQVVGVFENSTPVPPNPAQAIIPKVFAMYNPATQQTITTVAAGFFMAQKMPNALIGTVGAFQLDSTPDFPNGVNVGWSIPLAFGSNGVLVDANSTGNLENFADQTESQARQSSSSTASTGAKVTASLNSGSGSEGYMIVDFAPAA